ncbi:hypothetical protein DL93DRAFT_2078852 [Clavulina sp. PMI_390]|nr:hypothetical protein DL93DRAFT_2078852 [Clavulina sp. PMI_390]
MEKVFAHCKGKTACDPTEPDPEADPDTIPEELRKTGCGHTQPVIRKDGLKLYMVYKKTRDDDEVKAIGSLLMLEFVLSPFRTHRMSVSSFPTNVSSWPQKYTTL